MGKENISTRKYWISELQLGILLGFAKAHRFLEIQQYIEKEILPNQFIGELEAITDNTRKIGNRFQR